MIAALMLLQAAPAAPPPPDVAAMVETYRQRTSVAEPAGAGCVGGEGDEILVCGKTDAAMRIPLPEERVPDPNEPYHGEPRLDPGRPCPPTGCTGVNFVKGATFLYRLAHKIIDPDS
jgi:hypothetical protein